MNKKIPTPIAFGIIILLAVILGVSVWQYLKIASDTFSGIQILMNETEREIDKTIDWKIYKSKNRGFKVKYPEYLSASEEKITSTSVFVDFIKNNEVVFSIKLGGYYSQELMRMYTMEEWVESREADVKRNMIFGAGNYEGVSIRRNDIEIIYFQKDEKNILEIYKSSNLSQSVFQQILRSFEIIETKDEIDETDHWKIYRNREYKFEVKYPRDYFFKETLDWQENPTGYFLLRKAKSGETDWLIGIAVKRKLAADWTMPFKEYAVEEIIKNCAADGVMGSIYCTDIVEKRPFTNEQDIKGYAISVVEVDQRYKEDGGVEVLERIKGPIFALDSSQHNDSIRGVFFELTDAGEKSAEKDNFLEILKQMVSTFKFLD